MSHGVPCRAVQWWGAAGGCVGCPALTAALHLGQQGWVVHWAGKQSALSILCPRMAELTAGSAELFPVGPREEKWQGEQKTVLGEKKADALCTEMLVVFLSVLRQGEGEKHACWLDERLFLVAL